ncbi:hypothetical protein E4T42_07641 [Aureobasidium subglaciale]|nr:hypothetical protein E4T42_07641 [Aureobasidium subglaciale]
MWNRVDGPLGLGASLTVPCAQASISILFPEPHTRVKAYAIWGATGSTGFVVGPIFGGLFTSSASWRWIFWFSLIVEGALQALSIILLRSFTNSGGSNQGKDTTQIVSMFDPIGIVFSTPGLILLVYSLTSGNQSGWNTAGVIVPLILAAILLCAFVLTEVRFSSHPLIPRYLWSDRAKMTGCVLAAFTYAVWQGSNYLLTLELQGDHLHATNFGFSALQTAIRFLPLGLTALVVNSIVPSLLTPVGPSQLLVTSWILATTGVTLLAVLESKDQYWRYCFPGMVLYIAGVGTAYYVGNVLVVASAAPKDQGSTSGVYNVRYQTSNFGENKRG